MPKPIHIEKISPKSWSARVVDPLTHRRVRITDESEARIGARIAKMRAIQSELALGTIGHREAQREIGRTLHGAPTVREVWDVYVETLRGTHQDQTRHLWKKHFEPHFARARVWELSPEVMARWERARQDEALSPKTIQNLFWSLRAAVKMAMPDRVFEIPWKNWRPKPKASGDDESGREACRSRRELEDLIRAANLYDEDAAVYAPRGYADMSTRIAIGALCGLRQSEIAALGWDMIDLEGKPACGRCPSCGRDDPGGCSSYAPPVVRVWYASQPKWKEKHPEWVRPMDPPKGNKRATVVLHPHAVACLRAHRDRLIALGWYRLDGPVFPARKGAWRMHHKAIDGATFREIVEMARLPNVRAWTPHSLRHSFGTLEVAGALMQTGDAKGAQIRGRWSSPRVMQGYMHMLGRGRPESFIGEIDQSVLPNLLGPGPQSIKKLLESSAADTQTLGALVAKAAVIRDRSATERSMNMKELAVRYPTETPSVITDRAMGKYRAAYQRTERAGGTKTEAQEAGERAKRAFLGAFARCQRLPKDLTNHPKPEGKL